MGWARWVCAAIGALVMAAPFLFWTANPADYLSDTLVGALIVGFAVCTPPEAGPSPLALAPGPEKPPGWSYHPSSWPHSMPIILQIGRASCREDVCLNVYLSVGAVTVKKKSNT